MQGAGVSDAFAGGAVDWARVAQPQEDGYDTAVALRLAEAELRWRKPAGPAQAPVFCDGQVALRPWPDEETPGKHLVPGRLDHPNLARAAGYVKALWPAAYRQFTALVAACYPLTLRDCDESTSIGSCSGHDAQVPFTLYVTCFEAFGTAESMVHEMAHIKLRCLGVQSESSTRLVRNDPDELYVSPLRAFRRPMMAVAHAFYSWLHLTELGTRFAALDAPRARLRLARNLGWIAQMEGEIKAHARLDEAGERFFGELYGWSRRLHARGRTLLEAA